MSDCTPPVIPTFPVNPVIGQRYLNWVWTGTMWACQPLGPAWNLFVFLFSGVYTPSTGLTYATIECLGAGGGGGGAMSTLATPTGNGFVGGGGGGGGGGYSRSLLAAAIIGTAQIPITIGAGGTAGIAQGAGMAHGGTGGTTSFGGLVTAQGGQGGSTNNPAWGTPPTYRFGAPGAGALFGAGQVQLMGGAGTRGSSYSWIGTGSDAAFGGQGGGNAYVGLTGQVWGYPGYGSAGANGPAGVFSQGGGGAYSVSSSTFGNGGQGGNGVVLVTEYCGLVTAPAPSEAPA
jgi:hypothetical protein